MNLNTISADRNYNTLWVLATFLGWLLGFVFILIGAVAGDLLGVGGSQFIVGSAWAQVWISRRDDS